MFIAESIRDCSNNCYIRFLGGCLNKALAAFKRNTVKLIAGGLGWF